ncbi:MAG: polyphosphate kinase [Clostridiales bacterium]|nr:polyphosphate kinase [Clostridiales bacterium]
MQNREISWLRFNERVLDESMDETVPLLERLNFVSIFSSNLDEFFMIRVGSLFDLMNLKEASYDNKTGMTPKQQLDKIYDFVRPLYQKREVIYFNLERQLRLHDIYQLSYEELEKGERKYVDQYFHDNISPILSPQIIDTHHPFPHLQNKVLHVGAVLSNKDKICFGLVPLPIAIPEVVFLPGSQIRCIRSEDIISHYLKELFRFYQVKESVVLCVTRNADVNLEDEAYNDEKDFRIKMRNVIKQRTRLAPVRLELSNSIGKEFMEFLCSELKLKEAQVYQTKAPLKMECVSFLSERLTKEKKRTLRYRPYVPQPCSEWSPKDSILKQVKEKDILLSYPYESMEPFLKLIKEAGRDEATISIKITIYRLANKAKLVEYLCAAAENGKEVTVLIELRARFDEKNNIDWSERLEEAGCNVIYGFEDYKVHSKICLITRKERDNITYITQVGTGNFNEKTACLYTDLALITADKNIGLDAVEFFKNMSIGNLEGMYQQLLVSPVSLKRQVIDLIDREIEKAEKGRILIKINSITDIDIIEKLKQASCAGVRVKMIVRGICCLLPGIEGRTEHVIVESIVGRFLEHSRVYCFGTGEEERMFISSADFMTRNTERRVEVACPIFQEEIREKIHRILEVAEFDTEKARVMLPSGAYREKAKKGSSVDSQVLLMQEAEERAVNAAGNEIEPNHGILKWFVKRIKERKR